MTETPTTSSPTATPPTADQPPLPSEPAAAAKPNGQPEVAQDSWKDTFEQITIALIMAFVFRAFVVEAFVIPTGSMANTLMGRHYELTCGHCGYGPWSLSIPKEDGSRGVATGQSAPVCPNCNHHIGDWLADSRELLARPPTLGDWPGESSRGGGPKSRVAAAQSSPPGRSDTSSSRSGLGSQGGVIDDLESLYWNLPAEAGTPESIRGTLQRGPDGRLSLATDNGRVTLVDAGPLLLVRLAVGDPADPLGARRLRLVSMTVSQAALNPGLEVVADLGTLAPEWANRLERDLAGLVDRPVTLTGRPVIAGPNQTGILVDSARTDGPSPHSGDRILVLKYLYEFTAVHRWDVVVFRFPGDPKENYIKRVVGLPGEWVMILGGDVYHSDNGQDWRIARKPLESPSAQAALWHLVHTSDFPPRDGNYHPPTVRMTKRWQAVAGEGQGATTGSAWSGLEGATFRFEGRDANRQAIRYVQYLNGNFERVNAPPLANPRGADVAIFDSHSYNGNGNDYFRGGGIPPAHPAPNAPLRVTADLRVGADVIWREVATPQAMFETALTVWDDRYTLRLSPGGELALFATGRNLAVTPQTAPLATAALGPVVVGTPVRVELSHADLVVEARIDGRLVLQHVRDVSAKHFERLMSDAPELYSPALAPVVEMAAGGSVLELRHVRIDRDIYYSQESGSRRSESRAMGRGLRGQPIALSAGTADRTREYFMLGDNSAASSDSRFWPDAYAQGGEEPKASRAKVGGRLKSVPRYQLGTVPEEYLIGKAFFVYWPSGHYLVDDKFPVVPRAGRWRLIR